MKSFNIRRIIFSELMRRGIVPLPHWSFDLCHVHAPNAATTNGD